MESQFLLTLACQRPRYSYTFCAVRRSAAACGDKLPGSSRRDLYSHAAAADLHFLGPQLELQLGPGLQLLEKVLRVELGLRCRISIKQGCRVQCMLLRVCLHRIAHALSSY